MTVTAYMLWRAIKFLGLALYATGVLGPRDRTVGTARERLRPVWLAGYGLLIIWAAGFLLMKWTERQFGEAWIAWSLVTGYIAFAAVAEWAHRPTLSVGVQRVFGIAAATGLFASTFVMVYRGSDALTLLALTGAGLLLAVLFVLLVWKSGGDATGAGDRIGLAQASPSELATASLDWFVWVARFEGVSLIVMLLINIPLKRLAGLSLDGGTGLIGWTHGILVLLYLQGLWNTGNVQGWSYGFRAMGFVLSLIPGGTFYFEYLIAKREKQGAS